MLEGIPGGDVEAFIRAAIAVEYPAGNWICHQGQRTRQFFMLESGLVRLGQVTAEGQDVLVRFVTPGHVFGYSVLRPGGQTMSSAKPIRPSRLLVWDQAVALRFLHAFPRAAFNLFNIAAADAEYFQARSRRLLTDKVGQRVEWAVAELVRGIGMPGRTGVVIEGIAQRDIAELAGTTIFSVSRKLTELERRGVVEKQRRNIVVLKPEELSDSPEVA